MNRETVLTHNIRIAVNRTGRARLVRNNVGVDSVRGVRYGLGVGSPDLVGLIVGSGRAFALEVKTERGKPTKEQLAWLAAFRKAGGHGAIVRSVEDALTELDLAEWSKR